LAVPRGRLPPLRPLTGKRTDTRTPTRKSNWRSQKDSRIKGRDEAHSHGQGGRKGTNMAAPTPFQKRLAQVALKEFESFHLIRENQHPLRGRIEEYWTGIGLTFKTVAEAWSAVFVSWCVKQSGATAAQFRFAAAHARFMHAAIQNTSAGTGVFHGRRLTQYAPKVGDILQNNRGGNRFTFDFATANKSYMSHSAVVVEVGTDTTGRYLRTVGGNEGDSVGLKEVRLDAAGFVKNPDNVYIAAIESLL
jgi:hypothetical protein